MIGFPEGLLLWAICCIAALVVVLAPMRKR